MDDLNKSRIININDFIFRQNQEFYPNLQELTCEDNVLIYKINGAIVARETVTFDLRTLPGHVWNYPAKKFMEVIKFNKDCLTLADAADFINENAFNNVITPQNINQGITRTYTNEEIVEKTRIFFEGINNIENKNTSTDLTEAAQANVKKYELGVMVPYNDGKLNSNFMNAIKVGEEIYHNEHPNKEQTSTDLTRTAEMQALHGDGPKLALVKKEEHPLSMHKAGYVNVAILIYGMINIGIIVAIALIKG